MPKPRQVIASAEVIAAVTSRIEELLDALQQESYAAGQQSVSCDAPALTVSSTRESLLALVAGLAGRATYRVFIQPMQESHRITYWTTIVSSNRATSGRYCNDGRITPFMSENLEHAEYEAASWAAFLGTEVEPLVLPDWHEELKAKFDARRAAGQPSGSRTEGGARLDEYAAREAVVLTHQAMDFNTAMYVLMQRQLYDRDDAELEAFAEEGRTFEGDGIAAAQSLEALTRTLSAKPETAEADLLSAALNAALAYAMHANTQGARRALAFVPDHALAQSSTFAMVAKICDPWQWQTTTVTVHKDEVVMQFQQQWNLALTTADKRESAAALDVALKLLTKTAFASSMLEGSLVLNARVAAWQAHRLAKQVTGT